MSDVDDYLVETDYGFDWGGVVTTRLGSIRRRANEGLTRILRVGTNHRAIEIYVSPTGRSVRVFRDGRELK